MKFATIFAALLICGSVFAQEGGAAPAPGADAPKADGMKKMKKEHKKHGKKDKKADKM